MSPVPASRARRGFTLFELMVVIGLLGIIATISMPAVLRNLEKRPMRKAMDNLRDACRHARLKAVLENQPAELIIIAGTGELHVRTASDTAAPEPGAETEPPAGAQPEAAPQTAVSPLGAAPRRSGKVPDLHLQIPDSVAFKELRVNLRDMMDYTEARVRFYPDGTCDAFEAVLFSDNSEEQRLKLEVTTGREIVEVIR
ncbi:MAG: prepilin-type N-terminal cleavage/methylation domain-containing protein [Verrucomicrobia bacterium]|nr:MAG: prepilin-type N-terminal cleavage/methylation domain-containing protein [Verrucomicrobiota bacterium]